MQAIIKSTFSFIASMFMWQEFNRSAQPKQDTTTADEKVKPQEEWNYLLQLMSL